MTIAFDHILTQRFHEEMVAADQSGDEQLLRDMYDDALWNYGGKFAAACWQEATLRYDADKARSEAEQTCRWCSHVLATDGEIAEGICDECSVNPMCPACHRRESAHTLDEWGEVICRNDAATRGETR